MICTNTLNNLSKRYVPMVEPLRGKGYVGTYNQLKRYA